MNYFNIDIEKTVIELKKKAEDVFIKECKNPEKDENGQYQIPSLERSIESTITNYLEDKYEEIPKKSNEEYNKLYDELYERISVKLDKEEILESISPIQGDYWGLSEYQRNSGKY